eukprot:353082-Chlamydomonas_euryale.AAC.6
MLCDNNHDIELGLPAEISCDMCGGLHATVFSAQGEHVYRTTQAQYWSPVRQQQHVRTPKHGQTVARYRAGHANVEADRGGGRSETLCYRIPSHPSQLRRSTRRTNSKSELQGVDPQRVCLC